VATAAAGSSADRAGRRDLRPSGHLYIFFAGGTQTVKMQFDTIFRKYKTAAIFIPCWD